MKIFYTKKDRQIIEGLEMLEDAIKIQLDQANSMLHDDTMPETRRIFWKSRQLHCQYVLEQIQDIFNGKLHY